MMKMWFFCGFDKISWKNLLNWVKRRNYTFLFSNYVFHQKQSITFARFCPKKIWRKFFEHPSIFLLGKISQILKLCQNDSTLELIFTMKEKNYDKNNYIFLIHKFLTFILWSFIKIWAFLFFRGFCRFFLILSHSAPHSLPHHPPLFLPPPTPPKSIY